MALYQYSWAILFAPLLAFVIIVFGTRMWDLLSRPKAAVETTPVDAHAVEAAGAHGEDHGQHGEHDEHGEHGSDDDDPKVPHLTAGARASAYVGIFFMALACLYSWVLLVSSVVSPTPA
jgi:hypothetical protein